MAHNFIFLVTTCLMADAVFGYFQMYGFPDDLPPLRRVYGLSWDECLKECERTGSCKSVLFRRQTQNCRLYDRLASDMTTVSRTGRVYGEPAWRITKDEITTCLSPACSEGQACGTGGICVMAECREPQPIPVSRLRGDMRQIGAKIKYTCLSDYVTLEASEVSVCQANGTWSDVALICDCGTPIQLANALMEGSETVLGATVTYECKQGYHDNGGSTSSTCLTEGRWSFPTLECMDIDCGTVPVVENANAVFNQTTVGFNVTYTCHAGYVPNNGVDTSFCMQTGIWTAVNIVCTEINCGYPNMTAHVIAVQGDSTLYKANMTLACEYGYRSTNSDVTEEIVTCQQNGEWDGVELACEIDLTNMTDFGLSSTDEFCLPSSIVVQTYGTTVHTGVSRQECAESCRLETNYCTAISYRAANKTCVLVDRIHTVFNSSGWEILHKNINVSFSQGPNGWYTLTYPGAVDFCVSKGSTIATMQDIQSAYALGYNVNQCGWIEEEMAVIVLHYIHPGIYENTGINTCNWRSTWGVFCKVSI